MLRKPVLRDVAGVEQRVAEREVHPLERPAPQAAHADLVQRRVAAADEVLRHAERGGRLQPPVRCDLLLQFDAGQERECRDVAMDDVLEGVRQAVESGGQRELQAHAPSIVVRCAQPDLEWQPHDRHRVIADAVDPGAEGAREVPVDFFRWREAALLGRGGRGCPGDEQCGGEC